jgi:hypothetical protein
MKDSIKQKALLFLFLLLSTNILAQDNKRVSDTIRWEENHTVQWAQDVIIESNQVLVIDPGVRLQMEGSHSVIVYGEVLALGKADNLIRLSSYYEGWDWDDTATVAGGWGGFRFMNGAEKRSEFQHCIFSRGKNKMIIRRYA